MSRSAAPRPSEVSMGGSMPDRRCSSSMLDAALIAESASPTPSKRYLNTTTSEVSAALSGFFPDSRSAQ